jgi:hypothetical protein
MRTPSRLARVLVLIALFTVLAVAPGLAATAPAATPAPAASQATVTSSANAAFLATLSADLTGPQAPVFKSDCRSSTNGCPNGQLCCLACGYFGCDTNACFAPVNGDCPLFP